MSAFGVIIRTLHREPGKIINVLDLEAVAENSLLSTEEQFLTE